MQVRFLKLDLCLKSLYYIYIFNIYNACLNKYFNRTMTEIKLEVEQVNINKNQKATVIKNNEIKQPISNQNKQTNYNL